MTEEIQKEAKRGWYDKYYKIILFLSLLVLIFSLAYISFFYFQHGAFLNKDISLTGGTSITIYAVTDINKFESALAKYDITARELSDLYTGKMIGFTIETSYTIDEIKPDLENLLGFQLNEQNSSIEFTSSSLSESFFSELIKALVVAFILMGIVVAINFRTFVPSGAVMLSAFTDMIVPLAILNATGFRISSAGVAAFLMMIGFSVDTDIMLTNRVLRKKELSLNERLFLAFKTGMTMTLTALVAVFSAYLITIRFSPLLAGVFWILTLGLVVDLIATWGVNAAILKWYCEKKKI